MSIILEAERQRDISQLQQVVQLAVKWVSKARDNPAAKPEDEAQVRVRGLEGWEAGTGAAGAPFAAASVWPLRLLAGGKQYRRKVVV